ncbi:MAG: hypothetical protein QXS54_07430 [Candidatus Methanomethylicaceae archaeon]
MFLEPLRQAAENYLYTNDGAIQEQTRQQLVHAGTSAVVPLIEALLVTLRKFKSASWGKRQMQDFVDMVAEFVGPYADELRREIEGMPDREGEGLSMAQSVFSRQACERAWQVISQIGESGVRALFALVNGKDQRVRLAAMLVLNMEENPSRYILNALATSAPFQKEISSEVDAVAGLLALRIMALSGERRAREMLDQYGREFELSGSDFADALIDHAIFLLIQ